MDCRVGLRPPRNDGVVGRARRKWSGECAGEGACAPRRRCLSVGGSGALRPLLRHREDAASAFGLLAMTVWWGKRGASLFSEGGQIRGEVAPARVHCLYRLALTAAGAGLDLLFQPDGALHRSVQLVPHQPPAIVASAKTFLQTFAVLIGPPQEVGSDTSVERPVGAARHDVDGGEFILSHRCLLYQRAGRGVGGRRGIWN